MDANDRIGVHVVGLSFDGRNLGREMHGLVCKRPGQGVAGDQENDLLIERCCFSDFSGSGVRLTDAWAWHVRHSFFHKNRLDGLDASGSYDAWILDNILAGNGRYGIHGRVLAAATITANRIEWNHRGGIRIGPEYCDTVQVCNCLFDADYGPAIHVEGRKHFNVAITGNTFRRSGQDCQDRPEDDCHLRLINVQGLTVTGNTMLAGRVNSRVDKANPAAGLIIGGLRDSVIAANAMYHGAMQTLVDDRGGHDNLQLRDNPGTLQQRGELEL
jgi:hypothetical protein